MRLNKIQIEDYKSIKKLEWKLEESIICLVGQNESGKSNLIEVIELLEEGGFDTLEYEKHTNRSSDRFLAGKLPLIKATYTLDKSSLKRLKEGFEPYNDNTELLKDLTNQNVFIIQSIQDDDYETNYWFENDEEVFPLSYFIPNSAHITQALSIINSLKTKLVRLDDNYIDKFEIPIQTLKTNGQPDVSIVKLMRLTGAKFEKIPTDTKLIGKYLKQLNIRLNEKFTRKYYNQDDSVELNIVHNSGTIFLEIADNTDSEYAIHERSDGFKYFFGLLIEAASISSNQASDILFALDEPGAKLHPSGQRDLLRYLEDLSTRFRVLYTTHSPFLINRLYPNRVKVVERDKYKGTKFKFKGFSKNWHPMRSALGLSISDSFYYSEKALIVEGPEDIIFIGSILNKLANHDLIEINTDLFSFIDSGGEGNLPSMVQIMLDDERPTMVLIDSDSTSTLNKIKKKSKGLRSGLLVYNEISTFNKNAISIEDLIPSELLLKSLNNYLDELVEDGSLNFIKEKKQYLDNIVSNSSVYKEYIAPFVRDNYTSPSKEDEKWKKEQTPISKVGIARHFEKIINEDSFDFLLHKSQFADFIKLVKTVITKLKLKDE